MKQKKLHVYNYSITFMNNQYYIQILYIYIVVKNINIKSHKLDWLLKLKTNYIMSPDLYQVTDN